MESLLRFETKIKSPVGIDETLEVLPDGRLIFIQLQAVDAARRHRAGVFSTRLDPDDLEMARQLAEALHALPAGNGSQPPGALPRRVTAYLGESARSHALHPAERSPELLQRTAAAAHAWLQQALDAPYAVLELAARIRRRGDRDLLVISVTNPGAAGVAFHLDAGSITLRPDSAASPSWQNRERPKVGFIDSTGRLLDGVLVPAELAPGSRAAMSLLLPAHAASPDFYGDLSLSGQMSLPDPDRTPPSGVQSAFSVSCRIGSRGD